MNLLSTYIFEKLKLKVSSSLAARVRGSKSDRAEKYFKFIKFLQNLVYLPDTGILLLNELSSNKHLFTKEYNNIDDKNIFVPLSQDDTDPWKSYHKDKVIGYRCLIHIKTKYNEDELAKANKSKYLELLDEIVIDDKFNSYEDIKKYADKEGYLILYNIDKDNIKYFEKIGFTSYASVIKNCSNADKLGEYTKRQLETAIYISANDLLNNIKDIYDAFYDEDNDEIKEDPETIEDIKDDGEIENED